MLQIYFISFTPVFYNIKDVPSLFYNYKIMFVKLPGQVVTKYGEQRSSHGESGCVLQFSLF